jgi:hypothetical protein
MFSLFLYFPSAFSRIKVKLAFLLNKGKDFFTFKLCAYTKRISQEKLHLCGTFKGKEYEKERKKDLCHIFYSQDLLYLRFYATV